MCLKKAQEVQQISWKTKKMSDVCLQIDLLCDNHQSFVLCLLWDKQKGHIQL